MQLSVIAQQVNCRAVLAIILVDFSIILLLASTTYTIRLEFIDIPQLPFEEAKDWWLEESFKVLVRVSNVSSTCS